MAERAVQRDQSWPELNIYPASRFVRIGNGIDITRTHNVYKNGQNYEDQCFRHLSQNASDGTLVLGPGFMDAIPQLPRKVKIPDAITLDVSCENVWTLLALHEFKAGKNGKKRTAGKIEGLKKFLDYNRANSNLIRDLLLTTIGDEIPIPEHILIPKDPDFTLEFLFAIEKYTAQSRRSEVILMSWLPYVPPPAFSRGSIHSIINRF